MHLTSPSPDDGYMRQIIEYAGGYVLGALTTLVAFRVRLSKIDSHLAAHDKRFIEMENDHTVELTRLRAENDQRHRENQQQADLDRRMSRFNLKLTVAVARKMGVDHRVDDEVVEYFLNDSE